MSGSITGALLLLAGLTAAGQQSLPFDSDLVIRSTTNLVQVRIIAEDSNGKPVRDLKRSDFTIEDDRKLQPITLFSADRGTVSAAAKSPPDLTASDSTPAPAGYSVILLDWLNITYTYRVQAQEEVLALLKRYQPRQSVAIYLLDDESKLLHDFTADMDELRQAVEDAGVGSPGRPSDPQPDRVPARVGRAGEAELDGLMVTNRIFETLHTLGVISDHLAHVPGRKSLVWLTPGFPKTAGGVDFIPRIETALIAFNKSDVAVYTVNSCGLSSVCRGYDGPSTEIATRTGGMPIGGRNDLGEAMRWALEDMRISYTLGFNVPEGARLGPHAIRVKVNRPGVRLRYRQSYDWAGNIR